MTANIPLIKRQSEGLHSRWRRSVFMMKPGASFPSLMVQPGSSTSCFPAAEAESAVWEFVGLFPLFWVT